MADWPDLEDLAIEDDTLLEGFDPVSPLKGVVFDILKIVIGISVGVYIGETLGNL